MLTFLLKSRIFSIDLEFAKAIPAAKAPTIGDKPMYAASAAAPKHEAVAAASNVSSDLPRASRLIMRGRI